jgi:hypothetical protein
MVVHAKNVLLLTRSKWQYFYPIQQGMAKNCSADVSLVIDHIDSVLTTGTADEIHALKDMFGLAGLEHSDDFAAVLPNGPYQWQSNDFYTGYSLFFQWCDAVENAVPGAGTSTPATGVGLEKALAGYANWIKTVIVPGYCTGYGYSNPNDLTCFDSYNTTNTLYTDYTVGNPWDRQWLWFLCNEPFAYWQTYVYAPTFEPPDFESNQNTDNKAVAHREEHQALSLAS